MARLVPVDYEMRRDLPATLQAVEEFFLEFRRKGQAVLGRRNCFTTELLLREALTNAVLHGCRADPARRVRCRVRLKGRRLLIAVEDEGDGFDWRAASSKATESPECSGRGIRILRQYASRVRYNDKGNRVTMSKRF